MRVAFKKSNLSLRGTWTSYPPLKCVKLPVKIKSLRVDYFLWCSCKLSGMYPSLDLHTNLPS